MRLRGENKLEICLLLIALLTFEKVYANCMRKLKLNLDNNQEDHLIALYTNRIQQSILKSKNSLSRKWKC